MQQKVKSAFCRPVIPRKLRMLVSIYVLCGFSSIII